jgi:O-antigen ligase
MASKPASGRRALARNSDPRDMMRARQIETDGLLFALVVAVAVVVAGAGVGTGHAAYVLALALILLSALAIFAWPVAALRVFLILLPFGLYLPGVGGVQLFLWLPFALAISLALLVQTYDRDVPAWQPPAWAYLALLVICTLSALASGSPFAALSRVIYLMTFGVLALSVGRAVAGGLVSQVHVLVSFVLGAALAAAAVLAQFALQFAIGTTPTLQQLSAVFPLFGGDRAAATSLTNWYVPDLGIVRGIFPFMAAPSAGQYLMIAVVSAVFLLRQRELGAGRLLLWLNLGLVTAALGVTISRQSWIGAGVGVAIVLVRDRAGKVIVATILVALLLLSIKLPGASQSLGQYLLTSSDTASASSAERVILWNQAFDIISHNSVLGVGPGQYTAVFGGGHVTYAHNEVLDFFVETGPFGGLAFIVLALALLRAAWRSASRVALPLLATYLAANMFDDVFYFPKNGFEIAIIAGLACVARPVEEPAAEAVRSGSPAFARPAPPGSAVPAMAAHDGLRAPGLP